MGWGSLKGMASHRVQRWTQKSEQVRRGAPSPHLGTICLAAEGPHRNHP